MESKLDTVQALRREMLRHERIARSLTERAQHQTDALKRTLLSADAQYHRTLAGIRLEEMEELILREQRRENTSEQFLAG